MGLVRHPCCAQLTPAHKNGYAFSNQFLACLCQGQNAIETYGNETMVQVAGVCQSCSTTPATVKGDLSVS